MCWRERERIKILIRCIHTCFSCISLTESHQGWNHHLWRQKPDEIKANMVSLIIRNFTHNEDFGPVTDLMMLWFYSMLIHFPAMKPKGLESKSSNKRDFSPHMCYSSHAECLCCKKKKIPHQSVMWVISAPWEQFHKASNGEFCLFYDFWFCHIFTEGFMCSLSRAHAWAKPCHWTRKEKTWPFSTKAISLLLHFLNSV